MAWSLVTSKEESRSAFDGARQSFGRDASLFSDHSIGWQGGSRRFDVRWHPHLGIWGVFEPKAPLEKNPGRFWICFGVDDPAERAMLHITVETNPPIEGINRWVGGAFFETIRPVSCGWRTPAKSAEAGQESGLRDSGSFIQPIAPSTCQSAAQSYFFLVQSMLRISPNGFLHMCRRWLGLKRCYTEHWRLSVLGRCRTPSGG